MTSEPLPQTPASSNGRYLALVGLAIAVGWLWPMGSSLWLDEAGTFWIIKDGAREVFERSYYWSNFSPYFPVAWLAVQIGGESEIVIRLPSLLAMCAATVFVYRIGDRLCDRETGLLAAAVFVSLHEVAGAAAEARPYAFTLMALTGCVLALLRWLEQPGAARGGVVAVLAALTAYGHVLLAPGLIAPVLYAAWRATTRAGLAAIAIVSGLLTIPLAMQLRDYMATDTVHTFAGVPGLYDYLNALAPGKVFAPLMLGLVIAAARYATLRSEWRPGRDVLLMLTAWVVIPPSIFFLLGRTTDVQVFLPRYLASTAPALALLVASVLRSIQPRAARHLVVTVVVGLSVVSWVASSGFRRAQDWRGAMAAVHESTAEVDLPLVVVSCFVEAQTPRHLDDPRFAEVLFAPLTKYPSPARVIRLPFVLDEAFTDDVLTRRLAGEPGFLLLTCSENETSAWVMEHAEAHQFTLSRASEFKALRLLRFDRRTEGRP